MVQIQTYIIVALLSCMMWVAAYHGLSHILMR